ncbi:MAG: LamG-like jellyroll fold domain-containing protein [Cyclobacteriaceae bacterium]
MKTISLSITFLLILLLADNGDKFKPSERGIVYDKKPNTSDFTAQQSNANLSTALTFHVSFDNENGAEADFGKGDRKVYTANFKGGPDQTGVVSKAGLGTPALTTAKSKGKYGAALQFTKANTHSVFYNLENNVDYKQNNFNGSLSLWMSLDPNEIPGQYCDPVQLTDKYYASDAIWVDITKNDLPPDFRLGVYGDQKVWDTKNKAGASEEFFWRILKISQPPFQRDHWTHVVLTWEGLNTDSIGRAKLYLNGEYRGQSGPIREAFNWDPAKATMRLGIGDFIGMMDDIALFNKSLSSDEVKALYALKNGVKELHR